MALSPTLLIFWIHINSYKSQKQITWGSHTVVQISKSTRAEEWTLCNATPCVIRSGGSQYRRNIQWDYFDISDYFCENLDRCDSEFHSRMGVWTWLQCIQITERVPSEELRGKEFVWQLSFPRLLYESSLKNELLMWKQCVSRRNVIVTCSGMVIKHTVSQVTLYLPVNQNWANIHFMKHRIRANLMLYWEPVRSSRCPESGDGSDTAAVQRGAQSLTGTLMLSAWYTEHL